MKKLVIAATLAGFTTAAQAGAPADPVIEQPVVVEEAESTSGGAVLPLIVLAIIVAIAAAG